MSCRMFDNWEIVQKQKQVQYLRGKADKTSLIDWMELYGEAEGVFHKKNGR